MGDDATAASENGTSRTAAPMTVMNVIKYVLPDGTTHHRSWKTVCAWPPDLFAVVAILAERSGLYCEQAFMGDWIADFELDQRWIDQTRALGRDWAIKAKPPAGVQRLWAKLIREYSEEPIDGNSPSSLAWKKVVFKLISIADEACDGVGFQPGPNAKNAAQYIYYSDFIDWFEKDAPEMGGNFLPYIPHSLCVRVPPAVACVQPKTSTPATGCTLRSLTHHLALLPSIANVTTHWHVANKWEDDLTAFNVLIVPFPFMIPGKSFKPGKEVSRGVSEDRRFTIDPNVWMRECTPEDFAKFLLELIATANPELEPVHAVILPETALRVDFASKVAGFLARQDGLELFLTGVVGGSESAARNQAALYRFAEGAVANVLFQSKHHRWCLDAEQVRRYQLGHVLDPGTKWWEQIEVSYRNCYVTLFRPRATLSVLICEDLARHDPVVTVMNAMGPNLVIALLLDGPQLERRWPARYATVLADDPGSSVLTVTSFGMICRSTMPGQQLNREVALWKEPTGRAETLNLPQGSQGLLLTLTSHLVEQFTLDGRGDGKQTVHFRLGAAHGIRHPNPPAWLGTTP